MSRRRLDALAHLMRRRLSEQDGTTFHRAPSDVEEYLDGRDRKLAAAAAKRKRRGAKRLADRAASEAGR